MKTIKDLPVATGSELTEDTVFELASSTGGSAFVSQKLTYGQMFEEFKNRMRYDIESCVVRDPCMVVDPDEPVVLPPVVPPVQAILYDAGMLCMVYHTSRGKNFESKYNGVTNPLRLPDLVSVKMDWALAPQYVAKLLPPSTKLSKSTFGTSTWFPGEHKPPTGSTYPYVTPTQVNAEAGVGYTVMARYFGFMSIQESGMYGFRCRVEEGGTMWFGASSQPGVLGYECGPTEEAYPFINTDRNSTDGAGTRYFAQPPTQTGSKYLGFNTLYNGNVDFQNAVIAASASIPTNPAKPDQTRVYLKAGLYPYSVDIWGGGDKYGEGFTLEWVKGAGGTYAPIPGNILTHKRTDWTTISSITAPRPATGSHLHGPPATYGFTTSYTAQVPFGGPNIKFTPPHSYEV